MNETQRNFVVGVFVLGGISALAVLTVLFGQDSSWATRQAPFELRVRFASANGIRSGTPVTIGGIMVGRVSDVAFADPVDFSAGVRVVLAFDRPYSLPEGTRAETTEPGFGMGRPPIVLVPGDAAGAALPSGSEIPGAMSTMVESLIPPDIVQTVQRMATQLGDASEALAPVLHEMQNLLVARDPSEVDAEGGPPGNISTLITRFDTTIRNVNEIVGDPEFKNRSMAVLENLESASWDARILLDRLAKSSAETELLVADARRLMANADGTISRLDQRIETVANVIVADLEKAGRLIEQLQAVTASVQSGEGTLGRLVKDPKLYEALVLTFDRLAATVEEFRLLVKQWQEGRIKIGL